MQSRDRIFLVPLWFLEVLRDLCLQGRSRICSRRVYEDLPGLQTATVKLHGDHKDAASTNRHSAQRSLW